MSTHYGCHINIFPRQFQDIPRYAYNYAVNDPHTGDNKAQWEARDGDQVKGSYSLVEPDGSLRVVDYSANDLQGFNAVVKKIGPSLHPTSVLHGIAPVAHAPVLPLAPLNHLIAPINYGFGAAPLAIGLPKLGGWSLPWDPLTGSYGGWVPYDNPLLTVLGPHATIYSKKWKDGKLHKWVTGPISLAGGRKLVIRTTGKKGLL